ncbi:3-dehydroquinate synthase [Neptunomonas japonica]|uniref:3-dehydroquinate synthase n=1 Tax=Neptunomonas japonica JAMM 1380 TaxID=1441457 RepID=A0A7R6PRS0_9GAMM|nr:3-dehydroquinate synthase [Neptunomonas japonica]BBB28318.1 3-dehydroquinate synthase [Neptunomonas japonica JAMM 1380]
MQSLTVELGERSYPIYIGQNILSEALITPFIKGNQVMVVTNDTIAPLYLDTLLKCLPGLTVDVTVLPDGESFKDLTHLNLIFDKLLECRHNRTTTLIALGGGVVGDMTGFAAASYQRGVDFIQIPTTVLSQVDSSVGGKTGVNHPLGKNMIGAFYQPQLVLADISVFTTLPDRELSAGLAEVIKYGLIYDYTFFCWLEENIDGLVARDPDILMQAILRSCEIKAEVVAQDEKEGGIRAWLNLGHTFGHAIETHQGYGRWLHGEAVAAGTMMAMALSLSMGWLSPEDVDRARTLFEKTNLPILPPDNMGEDDFLELMSVDKKVLNGELRLVLLETLGKAVVTADYSKEKLMRVLSA